MSQDEMKFNTETSWKQAVHVIHDTKWFQAHDRWTSRRVVSFSLTTPNDLIVMFCEDILRALGNVPQKKSFSKITQIGKNKIVMMKSICDSSD